MAIAEIQTANARRVNERVADLRRRAAEAQARAASARADLEILKQVRANLVEAAKRSGFDLIAHGINEKAAWE